MFDSMGRCRVTGISLKNLNVFICRYLLRSYRPVLFTGLLSPNDLILGNVEYMLFYGFRVIETRNFIHIVAFGEDFINDFSSRRRKQSNRSKREA